MWDAVPHSNKRPERAGRTKRFTTIGRAVVMKKSWYTRQAEAEAQRNADLAARYAAMTERELVAELDAIARDDWAMRHDRDAWQGNWERIAKRNELARAELMTRRTAVAA